MKKIIPLLLIVTMLMLLFACTSDAPTDQPTSGEITDPHPDGDSEQTLPNEEVNTVKLSCNNRKLEIELADTVSAKAFADKLESGDVTIQMQGYGGFEMVGSLGFSLDRNDERMTTSVGDVVLYIGNQIVIFYGSNSWAYTKIGKIHNTTKEDLLAFFGTTHTVAVTFSLN